MAGRGGCFLFFLFFLITTYYSFSESSPHVLFQCNQECWKGSLGKVIEDIITCFLRFSVGLWSSTWGELPSVEYGNGVCRFAYVLGIAKV